MNESYEEDYQKIQTENKILTYEFRMRLLAICMLIIIFMSLEMWLKEPFEQFSLSVLIPALQDHSQEKEYRNFWIFLN